jgi:hypothetical protein
MKPRLLFLLLIPMQFVLSEPAREKFSEGPAPAWVSPCDFSLEPISPKPTQVNVQCLLIDSQRNWEEKTEYSHFAVKVLNQEGIRNVAQIKINFDPSYKTVVVHCIKFLELGQVWILLTIAA